MTENRTPPETPPVPDAQTQSAVAISAQEAERLLASNPAAAEEWARKFLAERAGNQGALLLLAVALRRQDKLADAKQALEGLIRSHPDSIRAHFELGLTLGALGEPREAIRVLTFAVDLMPNFPNAWYALADQLHILQHRPQWHAGLREARNALRMGRQAEAESLLAECVELYPDHGSARLLLAIVLLAQEKGRHALPLIAQLRAAEPGNALYRDLHAAAFFQVEEFEEAILLYEGILEESPDRPGAWMSYGRALRALGREEQCIAAFKKAIELLPTWVEARRTLASVKTYRFAAGEIESVRAQLARTDLSPMNYAELHFALARALEDVGEYAESFANYQRSQSLQHANIPYSAEASKRYIRRVMSLFTAAFLRERAGLGHQSSAPIFVVGMPRAGSTLVQEILCAHSRIERTGELRQLTWMTARLDAEKSPSGVAPRYPEVIRNFDNERFKALGEEYLQRSLLHRGLRRPFFVDKYPGNFVHAGLIHLILPHAKIVDVRRHPLDCCLSCFKNYFPEGPPFSHTLGDLGRYYADYVELMAHFDEVLPGKVHRVFYEDLVENPETEVRRLLDYLNLHFEEECLRYYEQEQAIMTSSSEQVRMPIYQAGVGAWRKFEKWINPLKAALGPVLDNYPAAPKFYKPLQISTTIRLA